MILAKSIAGLFALTLAPILVWTVSYAAEDAVVVPSQPQFLGKFLVRDITSTGGTHQGTLCQPYTDSDGNVQDADYRCGQVLLVYRSAEKDQIVFLQAPQGEVTPTDHLYTFGVFHGALFASNRLCDSSLRAQDVSSMFESRLCRGFLGSNVNNDGADHYVFFPNMEPKSGQICDPTDEAAARMIVTGMIIGIPIGMSSAYDIAVPRLVNDTLTINEELVGVALVVKSTIINKISLVRVN